MTGAGEPPTGGTRTSPHELPQAPAAPEEPPAPDAWQRLDRRTLGVSAVYAVGISVAAGAGLVLRATVPLWLVLLGAVVLVAGFVALDYLRWVKTRYRITEARFELHTGILFRNRKSIPTERIRSVDATANPVQRAFGVAILKIGTGEHASSDDELKLDVVSRHTAEALRGTLLNRTAHAPAATRPPGSDEPDTVQESAAPATGATDHGERTLAELNWAWIRYAPLTLSSVLGIGAILGVAYKPLDALGMNPFEMGLVRGAVREFEAHPLWVSIGVVALAALLLGVVGSLVLFVEAWWRFRLTREDAAGTDTFRVRRGLLTTRSVTLEQRRLRGVEITEPLLLRWGGGARTYAVATGMRQDDKSTEQANVLLPPTPRPVSEQVSAEVLAEQSAPTRAVRLHTHPRAALRRRLVWSLTPVVVLASALAVVGRLFDWMPGWAWAVALSLLVPAVLFAVDAYRNLGHGLTERYLVTRSGTGVRRTVALQRTGILGWTMRQSLFQRRAGLCTLTATTAAGGGQYHIRDVDARSGLAVAEQAVPGLLAPFVEKPETTVPVSDNEEPVREEPGPAEGQAR